MARLSRFVIPDQPQHVIVRGNNRAEIFNADADYQLYLEKLQLACGKAADTETNGEAGIEKSENFRINRV